MGIAYALLAMLCFATNIVITRYAVARLPVEAGFFVVLATNVLFPAALFAAELGVRAAPYAWNWKGAGLFAIGGVIGTFLGRQVPVRHGEAARALARERVPLHRAGVCADRRLAARRRDPRRLRDRADGWWCGRACGSRSRAPGPLQALAPELLRKGFAAGLLTVAGFGFGNVLRGIAMRDWEEAALGTVIASVAALACQFAVTRNWERIGAQLRGAERKAIWLYVGCGVFTSLGSIFISLAMTRIEIALAVLVVHTTPLVIFPVSVFLLKNREELTPRTVAGRAGRARRHRAARPALTR